MRIVLIGPQASGKGTQAELLSKTLDVPHISTGDIFRHEIHEHTKLGQRVQAITEKGDLVPDQLVDDVVRGRLEQDDCTKGFIIEGFPRDLEQARWMDEQFPVDLVIELKVSDAVALKRAAARVEVVDGKQKHRADDTPEAIQHRLELYHKETEPLLTFYRAQNKLVSINGDRSIEAIAADLKTAVQKSAQ